jgi:hypothetical protein
MRLPVKIVYIYIAIICIFALNVKMYVDTVRVKKIAKLNNENWIIANKKIDTLYRNDSLFFNLAKTSLMNDSIKIEQLKKNYLLLMQNHKLLIHIDSMLSK